TLQDKRCVEGRRQAPRYALRPDVVGDMPGEFAFRNTQIAKPARNLPPRMLAQQHDTARPVAVDDFEGGGVFGGKQSPTCLRVGISSLQHAFPFGLATSAKAPPPTRMTKSWPPPRAGSGIQYGRLERK